MNMILEGLNGPQKEAVVTTEGPVLILAGAGSGKTKALTHRIAYIIDQKLAQPWNILAITFTNKAAGEMRDRVDVLTGEKGQDVWVSTFHSMCAKILRRYAEKLGYTSSFSIYDTDEQKTLIRQVVSSLELDKKNYPERSMLSIISSAKNSMLTPDLFEKENMGDFRMRKVSDIYRTYQEQLQKNNAMDFDDLLLKTVELFEYNEDVLSYYQDRFRYIHVDEYQDTNAVQFRLVSMLAKKHRNLCVVGDDDQSIYKFRGADIRNILDFEKTFPDAVVIRLEQNYRSTKNILGVANEVIRNNQGRKDKTLWTKNDAGPQVEFYEYESAYDEADGVIRDIIQNKEKYPYGSCAVLYRTNAQSRIFEEKCVAYNVPYRMVGGVNFYQRKEIKDLISYLKTIENGRDDLAVLRIINVPRRGIGNVTLARLESIAAEAGMSLYDVIQEGSLLSGIGRAAGKITEFGKQLAAFRQLAAGITVKDLLEKVLDETGYKAELIAEDTVESKARIENIEELISKAAEFGDEPDDPEALGRFLEEVALVADVDSLNNDDDRVVLMTLHAAKGLEFPKVYMAGMEEGLFPGRMAMFSGDEDIEEERRLCYVGMTRAKESLALTAAHSRMLNGETTYPKTSRFVNEIPSNMLRKKIRTVAAKSMKQAAYKDVDSINGSYRPKARILGTNASANYRVGRDFTTERADSLDYAVGDRVRHIKFGEGTVQKIEEGKKDFEVTVNFDRVGVKNLFASFAKLKKV